MLSGGASRVEGFAEALRERFDTHGRAVRSVPAGDVRRQASWASPPRRWRRWRPWRSASRCGGWGTDDSHQPASPANAARRRPPAARFEIGQKITVAGSLILRGHGAARSAGATGRSVSTKRSSTRDIDAARARRSAARRSAQAGRRVRGASARSCRSASRSSTSCAAARPRRCT